MIRGRRGLVVAMVAVFAVVLTACSGLPTSGDVTPGMPLGDTDLPPDISQIAAGPLVGASPEEIVEGFMDAALTPTDSWATARQFLSAELSETWKPSVEVTIDSGAARREFAADLDSEQETASSADVEVLMDQVAIVDEFGAYTELSGESSVKSFELARDDAGEWRITTAANGIVLDAEAFPQVFRRYALQYYDQSWTRLIPDIRWYPRRPQIATTLTQALLSGSPSGWLTSAVRSAFPSDVALAGAAVPVDPEKVATVELTASALSLDATELSRMRTQLEETLRLAGVSEVRLMVNGRDLNAGKATVDVLKPEPGTVVLTATEFGSYVGDEITAYEGITPKLVDIAPSVRAVDVAVDGTRTAVQLDTGAVWTMASGSADVLDSREGLIEPSMDPYGYTWSVPTGSPQALTAWRSDVTSFEIADAFPEAASISHIRVGPDGVRLAAIVMVGGQRWIGLAAIIRDEDEVPVELGAMHMVAQLDTTALGLSWVGEDTLSVLLDVEGNRTVLTQDVGGPGTFAAAPAGAQSLSGGRTLTAVRILNGDGVLFAQRGTTWQIGLSDVLVLGTHAGQ
ncbi:GerMN domain-containing protein [Microbacterium sp. A84]|uniref:GerMN domain-containing protein n=1 Tax=Microbacterium sp. A84 TaxID=3450715 RepID=UPI003F43C25A